MSLAQQLIVMALGAVALIGIVAGIVIYFRKSLSDQLIARYKEVHEADVARIEQLEQELQRTNARLSIVERENEVLKGLAIGRDLLTMISEQMATQHKEVMQALRNNTTALERVPQDGQSGESIA